MRDANAIPLLAQILFTRIAQNNPKIFLIKKPNDFWNLFGGFVRNLSKWKSHKLLISIPKHEQCCKLNCVPSAKLKSRARLFSGNEKKTFYDPSRKNIP